MFQAILNMPEPTCKEELIRFLAIIGYIQKFIPHLSDEIHLLRQITHKSIAWHWEEAHQQAFQRLKSLVSQTPTLQFFDVNKPVTIQTDASQVGLGAVLLQNNLPVYYASQSLNKTQQNYAVIEKELLAIAFACIKFHDFNFGRSVVVLTDHQPLIGITKKPIHECSPRIQRIRMKLLHYDLKLTYIPGKQNVVADVLSHSPLPESQHQELEDTDLQVCAIQATPRFVEKVQEATRNDACLQSVIKMTKEGWDTAALPKYTPYAAVKDDLSIEKGMLFKGSRLVIPQSMKK